MNERVFRKAMQMYGEDGNLEDAQRVFKLVKESTSTPDRQTYWALIRILEKHGDVDNGCKLFEEMKLITRQMP